MLSLNNYARNLNLFKPSLDNNEVEDNQKRRSNIIATRVYIIILILVLFVVGLVLLVIHQKINITVRNPTRQQFDDLPEDAQCSCSHISLHYGKFTTLQATFHQVCLSDFVSDRWLRAINSGSNSTYFDVYDFRTYGSAQFQALAAFCSLSKANIEQNINLFYLNTLLSPKILSETVLRSQIEASIDQLKSTAPNTFKGQLRLVNQMTMNNRLVSGLQTNQLFAYFHNPDNGKRIRSKPMQYMKGNILLCRCDLQICRNIVSGFYDIFRASTTISNKSIEWYIHGISVGCLPVQSILRSTLECFYDQICLNKLVSYFPTNETFTAMTIAKESRHSPNSTVQSMVDDLMTEKWITNISYDNYYYQCEPSSCTYYKVSRYSFVFVLTKLISLLASLTLVLRLIIPHLVRFIQRVRDPTSSPRIPVRIRWRQFKAFIRKTVVELNLFKYYPSSDRQLRYQRYGTRLYIYLIVISIAILTAYTFLQKSTHSKIILNPTLSEYKQLEREYSLSLSCPCNSISMSYSTFITIQPHYHQLCSSDLISEKWIMYIQKSYSDQLDINYLDYRLNAPAQFRSLSMFCQQVQQTINDTLRVFFQAQFVSSHVLSQKSFKVQMDSIIQDWQSTTVNTSMRTIQLIRATTQGNRLLNSLSNTFFYINTVSRQTTIVTLTYSRCTCALSASCRTDVGIFDYNANTAMFNEIYTVQNFFIGCYPVEALLASTLECFYNRSCMLEIHKHIAPMLNFTFSALNASHNLPNETIESIVNQAMVDRWSSHNSFSSYYNRCAPSSCIFQYERRNNFLFVITTIASIFGGLTLGLKVIIFITLKCIDKIMTNGFSPLILLHSVKHLFTPNTEHQILDRLHFLLVITILYVIYIFSAFTPHTTTVRIAVPSLNTYNDLVAKSYDLLQCPCSQTLIKYKLFLTMKPRFHQVCSSNFISDRWIAYLYGANDPVYSYLPTDFYYSASGQFQSLALLCKISEQTVTDTLFQLGASDFVNIQVLPLSLFEDRVRGTINEFQLTMPNLFVNTLSLIRETTKANMLMSTLSTSWVFDIPSNISNKWTAHTIPLEYQGCSCALSSKCVSPSQGMFTGCYPLEAILQATFECLYDQQCIDSKNIFKALNISLLTSSRFHIDTTIESIVNELMVEEFSSVISYESYFNQCAPLSCTYSRVNNNNIIEGITTMIGLYGGLLIICRLLSIFIVKQCLCITSRITPITN